MTAVNLSQAGVLVLEEGVGEVRVSMAPVLVLTKLSTESRVSQLALLTLARRIGKRVFTQIDIGNG